MLETVWKRHPSNRGPCAPATRPVLTAQGPGSFPTHFQACPIFGNALELTYSMDFNATSINAAISGPNPPVLQNKNAPSTRTYTHTHFAFWCIRSLSQTKIWVIYFGPLYKTMSSSSWLGPAFFFGHVILSGVVNGQNWWRRVLARKNQLVSGEWKSWGEGEHFWMLLQMGPLNFVWPTY